MGLFKRWSIASPIIAIGIAKYHWNLMYIITFGKLALHVSTIIRQLGDYIQLTSMLSATEEHTGDTPTSTRPGTVSTGNTPLPTSIRPPTKMSSRHPRSHPVPLTPSSRGVKSDSKSPRPPVTPTGIVVTIDTARSVKSSRSPDSSRTLSSRDKHRKQTKPKATKASWCESYK